MPTVDIKDLSGAKVGSLELDESVWGADLNEHLLWEAVKWQRAKARAGSASSLRPSEVRGTNKKPYRQKGTGNARQGTQKGAHHVGGGRVFGPKPRDYDYALPKKVKKAALRVALSQRVRENKLIIVDAFAVDKLAIPARKAAGTGGARLTLRVQKALQSLGAGKALVVDAGNELLQRGVKNLKAAKWLAPEGLNVYDVLKYDTLIITASTAKQVEDALRAS